MNLYPRIFPRLVITLCVVTSFLASGLETYACTCMGQSSMKESVRTVDILVTGTILAQNSYPDFICYTVVVSRDFKDTAPADTIYIYSGHGNGDCGFVFAPEKEYIVYAYISPYLEKYSTNERNGRIGREYVTDICTRTQQKNEEEIENIEKEL